MNEDPKKAAMLKAIHAQESLEAAQAKIDEAAALAEPFLQLRHVAQERRLGAVQVEHLVLEDLGPVAAQIGMSHIIHQDKNHVGWFRFACTGSGQQKDQHHRCRDGIQIIKEGYIGNVLQPFNNYRKDEKGGGILKETVLPAECPHSGQQNKGIGYGGIQFQNPGIFRKKRVSYGQE